MATLASASTIYCYNQTMQELPVNPMHVETKLARVDYELGKSYVLNWMIFRKELWTKSKAQLMITTVSDRAINAGSHRLVDEAYQSFEDKKLATKINA